MEIFLYGGQNIRTNLRERPTNSLLDPVKCRSSTPEQLEKSKKKILRAWPQESNAEQLYMCGAHPPTTRSNPRGLLCNILTFQLLGRLLNQHLNHAQWDARYDEK